MDGEFVCLSPILLPAKDAHLGEVVLRACAYSSLTLGKFHSR